MTNSNFNFVIRPTDTKKPLTVTVWLDSTCMFGPMIMDGDRAVSVPIVDDEASHNLHIELSGKTASHTVLDDQQHIVSDSMIRIEDLRLDDSDITSIVHKTATYCHDTNGTTETKTDPFFGVMGCNGRVTLSFETPAYLWLLDNL